MKYVSVEAKVVEWIPTPYIEFHKKVLMQKWVNKSTGKEEWREVKTKKKNND